ncbi:MAG: spore coat protein CotJB [Clostridiaceae bacterium]
MSNCKNKEELLKQITALDFIMIDLHLYLNTHPTDRIALEKHNSVVMEANMLKSDYEKNYGPLTYGSCSYYPWQWINEPWPWEAEANFKL